MGILMAEISALSTCHPEQNPALAGQNIYQSKEIVDKQICRLIGALLPCFSLVSGMHSNSRL